MAIIELQWDHPRVVTVYGRRAIDDFRGAQGPRAALFLIAPVGTLAAGKVPDAGKYKDGGRTRREFHCRAVYLRDLVNA